MKLIQVIFWPMYNLMSKVHLMKTIGGSELKKKSKRQQQQQQQTIAGKIVTHNKIRTHTQKIVTNKMKSRKLSQLYVL